MRKRYNRVVKKSYKSPILYCHQCEDHYHMNSFYDRRGVINGVLYISKMNICKNCHAENVSKSRVLNIDKYKNYQQNYRNEKRAII
jgi:hypothetical protein